jgi:hypothetical protein
MQDPMKVLLKHAGPDEGFDNIANPCSGLKPPVPMKPLLKLQILMMLLSKLAGPDEAFV